MYECINFIYNMLTSREAIIYINTLKNIYVLLSN